MRGLLSAISNVERNGDAAGSGCARLFATLAKTTAKTV